MSQSNNSTAAAPSTPNRTHGPRPLGPKVQSIMQNLAQASSGNGSCSRKITKADPLFSGVESSGPSSTCGVPFCHCDGPLCHCGGPPSNSDIHSHETCPICQELQLTLCTSQQQEKHLRQDLIESQETLKLALEGSEDKLIKSLRVEIVEKAESISTLRREIERNANGCGNCSVLRIDRDKYLGQVGQYRGLYGPL
ncbi:hypothetical protein EJ08DRAFT_383758 [Tothia fuscella]|uniref:Uncharacterized protein n=1 Tax=Tothia fuscella TaxID=1048955 RepID=A0A9P4TUT8_9PEZI|nr:hypothetical protein EJ08DRAFT_383758 [Tothia fuscella]